MMTLKLLSTRTLLAFAALGVAGAGCGQNANIAKKSALDSTSESNRLTTTPRSQPGETPVREKNPIPAKEIEPEPIVGPTGPTGPSGPEVLACPAPHTPPAPIAPVVVEGKDGKDGRDGRDGKDAKGRDGCGNTDKSVDAKAVPMKPTEFAKKDLPYKTTKKHPIAILKMDPKKGNKRQKVDGVKTEYVKDAQVLFKFPLRLPPRAAINKLHALKITLDLVKLSEDDYPDTEWLCFLDQKICSGKAFPQKTWQGNVNKAFWDSLNGPFTDSFVTQLKGEKVAQFRGMTLWKSGAFELDVAAMIAGSKYEDLVSFIYEGADPNKPLVKELRMAVADDTMVNGATFSLEYEENTCTTFELQGKKE